MIEFAGYFFAVVIGLILGLLGGGGAILTVPVLVYIMGIHPVFATAYSLFIVGTTSAVGTMKNLRDGMVHLKSGLFFAIPSLIGVYSARMFVVPAIPDIIFTVDDVTLRKGTALMILLAIVMVFASWSMLKKSVAEKPVTPDRNKTLTLFLLFLAGLLVGLVGAGGGFLFIPLLLHLMRIDIRQAIATSLLIITINSLIGFTGDLAHLTIDWAFLIVFTGFSIVGVIGGIYLGRFIRAERLKRIFGWFLLLMAVIIFTRELL